MKILDLFMLTYFLWTAII